MSDDREGESERGGRQGEEVIREVEAELEGLAADIAARIDASPAADRGALHDYAVSLVRERLPVVGEATLSPEGESGDDESADGAKGARSGGAGALGFSVLLFLVGFLLVPVFAPVGLMLLGTSGALMLWGLVAALLTKVRGVGEEETS